MAPQDAVRAAEQSVADAWIGRLLLAANEAEVVAGACGRVRAGAAERVRAAQTADDLALLAQAQTDLENADRAWNGALADLEHARRLLAYELTGWVDGTVERAREERGDRPEG